MPRSPHAIRGSSRTRSVPFLDRLRQQGFNRLNVMHLFRACAFVAKPDGRVRTPLHELERREVLSAWKAAERAADQAVGLIRSEARACEHGHPVVRRFWFQ